MKKYSLLTIIFLLVTSCQNNNNKQNYEVKYNKLDKKNTLETKLKSESLIGSNGKDSIIFGEKWRKWRKWRKWKRYNRFTIETLYLFIIYINHFHNTKPTSPYLSLINFFCIHKII